MNPSQLQLPGNRILAILCVPVLVAFCVSGYLTYASVTASEIAGCSGGELFDCGHVLYSKWSKFAGIPVSAMALATYIVIGASLVILSISSCSDKLKRWAWIAVKALAVVASFAALYFIFLQVFVLKHLCTYCLVAHTCGLIVASLVFLSHSVNMSEALSYVGFAAMSVAVLSVVQYSSAEPQKYKIETYESPTSSSTELLLEAPGEEQNADVKEDDLFSPPSDGDESLEDDLFQAPKDEEDVDRVSFNRLMPSLLIGSWSSLVSIPAHGNLGRPNLQIQDEKQIASFSGIRLDVSQWPSVGPDDADYIFVSMYDYTCHHCRSTHEAIKKAKEQLKDKVTIVTLPVPMNTNCNPHIKKTHPSHLESCELSRLAVCIWRIEPEKFEKFHHWMFESEQCPTYSNALAKAVELVGQEKIDKELNKKIVSQYVDKHVQLYKHVGAGQLPKILFDKSTIVGEFSSAEDLAKMIENQASK